MCFWLDIQLRLRIFSIDKLSFWSNIIRPNNPLSVNLQFAWIFSLDYGRFSSMNYLPCWCINLLNKFREVLNSWKFIYQRKRINNNISLSNSCFFSLFIQFELIALKHLTKKIKVSFYLITLLRHSLDGYLTVNSGFLYFHQIQVLISDC